MNSKLPIAILVLCLGVATRGSAADSYLCIPDMATGFRFNENSKKWEISKFKTDGKKYILSKSKYSPFAWEVKEMGENYPFIMCEDDFNTDGDLICSHLNEFKMNNKTLRFLNAYLVGYVYYSDFEPFKFELPEYAENLSKEQLEAYKELQKNYYDMSREGKNTPYIEIGKCSPL